MSTPCATYIGHPGGRHSTCASLRAGTICRDIDEHHRLQWDLAADEVGQQMMALVKAANGLRKTYPSLRHGEVQPWTMQLLLP